MHGITQNFKSQTSPVQMLCVEPSSCAFICKCMEMYTRYSHVYWVTVSKKQSVNV